LFDEVAVTDDDAAHGVAVPVVVLREGVDDEVGAVVEGPHHRRWREGGVDGQQRTGVVGDAGERGHVGDALVGNTSVKSPATRM
jgi:hypothetical protein